MDERIKNKLYLILSFLLLCLLFLPPNTAYAYFSDIISEDTGIELTLGTVDLSVPNQTPTNYTLEKGTNTVKLVNIVSNRGSLSGKVAYRIKLKSKENTASSYDLRSNIKFTLNDEPLEVNDGYTLLPNKEAFTILHPKDSVEVPIKMEVKNYPSKDEHIEVQIEFLLFQTNGTIEKPLFYDEERIKYEVEIKKVDDFWPEGKITTTTANGNYTYAVELPEFSYFSDPRGLYPIIYELFHQSTNYGTLYLEKNNGDFVINVLEKNLDFSKSDMSLLNIESVTNNRVKINFIMEKSLGSQFLKLDNSADSYNGVTTQITLNENKNTYNYFWFKYSAKREKDEQNSAQKSISVNSNVNVSDKTLVESEEGNLSNNTSGSKGLAKTETQPSVEATIESIEQEAAIEIVPKKEDEVSTAPTEFEKEISQEILEGPSKSATVLENGELPLSEEFNYVPLKLDEQTYEIGITQEQFGILFEFTTLEEFAAQITEKTPRLYIKYDKVTGIEGIEQFVYELAEKENLGLEIDLRTIPEEKLLEITFTK